jgi:hypothetical protein
MCHDMVWHWGHWKSLGSRHIRADLQHEVPDVAVLWQLVTCGQHHHRAFRCYALCLHLRACCRCDVACWLCLLACHELTHILVAHKGAQGLVGGPAASAAYSVQSRGRVREFTCNLAPSSCWVAGPLLKTNFRRGSVQVDGVPPSAWMKSLGHNQRQNGWPSWACMCLSLLHDNPTRYCMTLSAVCTCFSCLALACATQRRSVLSSSHGGLPVPLPGPSLYPGGLPGPMPGPGPLSMCPLNPISGRQGLDHGPWRSVGESGALPGPGLGPGGLPVASGPCRGWGPSQCAPSVADTVPQATMGGAATNGDCMQCSLCRLSANWPCGLEFENS